MKVLRELRWMSLNWRLRGLPRCSQPEYPPVEPIVDHCWGLIWPWQEGERRGGGRVHSRHFADLVRPEEPPE